MLCFFAFDSRSPQMTSRGLRHRSEGTLRQPSCELACCQLSSCPAGLRMATGSALRVFEQAFDLVKISPWRPAWRNGLVKSGCGFLVITYLYFRAGKQYGYALLFWTMLLLFLKQKLWFNNNCWKIKTNNVCASHTKHETMSAYIWSASGDPHNY